MSLLLKEYWLGFFSAIAGWMSAFLVPLGPFLGIVVFLVVCDLVTGLRAATKRGEVITSTGLRRTIEKIILYFIALLLSEGMKVVFVPAAPVTYVTAFAIAITEFKSNIENIEAVTGVKVWEGLKNLFANAIPPRAKKP